MHGNFVGLEVVFISAVLLPCKRLSVLVVEVSGQSRISFKSIIMEYTPIGDLCASTGKYEIGGRGVGMEGGYGDIRVDAAGSLFGLSGRAELLHLEIQVRTPCVMQTVGMPSAQLSGLGCAAYYVLPREDLLSFSERNSSEIAC